MTLIAIIGFWLLGWIIGQVLLFQILLIVFFAAPLTQSLAIRGLVKSRGIWARMVLQCAAATVLFSLASWGVHVWFPTWAMAYWVGAGIAFASCIWACRDTPKNRAIYVTTYLPYLDRGVMTMFSEERHDGHSSESTEG